MRMLRPNDRRGCCKFKREKCRTDILWRIDRGLDELLEWLHDVLDARVITFTLRILPEEVFEKGHMGNIK